MLNPYAQILLWLRYRLLLVIPCPTCKVHVRMYSLDIPSHTHTTMITTYFQISVIFPGYEKHRTATTTIWHFVFE